MQLSFGDVLQPAARASDPDTSHEAARVVQAGNGPLIAAIRKVLIEGGPQNAWEIAYAVEDVHGDRWAIDSIRTAVARTPGVERFPVDSTSPRGNRCHTWWIRTENVDVTGERL